MLDSSYSVSNLSDKFLQYNTFLYSIQPQKPESFTPYRLSMEDQTVIHFLRTVAQIQDNVVSCFTPILFKLCLKAMSINSLGDILFSTIMYH
jgi:hypothetical protein